MLCAVYNIIFQVLVFARLLMWETVFMQDVKRCILMHMISISTQYQIIGKICDLFPIFPFSQLKIHLPLLSLK